LQADATIVVRAYTIYDIVIGRLGIEIETVKGITLAIVSHHNIIDVHANDSIVIIIAGVVVNGVTPPYHNPATVWTVYVVIANVVINMIIVSSCYVYIYINAIIGVFIAIIVRYGVVFGIDLQINAVVIAVFAKIMGYSIAIALAIKIDATISDTADIPANYVAVRRNFQLNVTSIAIVISRTKIILYNIVCWVG
jgi:hypothetical protein